jgi:CRISPR/Cas system CMR subunit Cmr4 (Cas7 group RAMP superfamily)
MPHGFRSFLSCLERLRTRSCVTSSDHSSSYSKQSAHRRASFRIDRDQGTTANASEMDIFG